MSCVAHKKDHKDLDLPMFVGPHHDISDRGTEVYSQTKKRRHRRGISPPRAEKKEKRRTVVGKENPLLYYRFPPHLIEDLNIKIDCVLPI